VIGLTLFEKQPILQAFPRPPDPNVIVDPANQLNLFG